MQRADNPVLATAKSKDGKRELAFVLSDIHLSDAGKECVEHLIFFLEHPEEIEPGVAQNGVA